MVNRLLTTTNIPASFTNTNFEDYDVTRRKGARKALEQIEDWTPTVTKPALLLQGQPNVGKTMLASALLNDYHARYPLEQASPTARTYLRQERLPVYFVQLAEWLDLQIRVFNLHNDVMRGIKEPDEYLELDTLLQDLKYKVEVLVVDDVGKEHHTSSNFAEDAFDLLVRTRHNNGLITIYTTNLPIYRWSSQYSDSMQSLIERSSKIVVF